MSEQFSSNNASLFRLINSPAVNCWILLEYLWKYKKKETGLQHHILTRLRSFPPSDVNSILPQLCHILFSNHWENVPLEYFIINYARENRHASIYLLWTIESYINDYAREYLDYRFLFARSVRILGRLQKAIFSFKPPLNNKKRTKSLPGLAVNLVSSGLGPLSLLFPSFIDEVCSPMLTGHHESKSPPTPSSTLVKKKMNALSKQGSFEVINAFPNSNSASPSAKNTTISPTIEELSSGSAFQLIKSFVDVNFSSASLDKLSSLTMSSTLSSSQTLNIKQYKHNDIITFMYYTEQQFINSLLDISIRLENVPIENRSQTLANELTLINHNLPAPICLPLNCDGLNIHHRILRVCTSEAVVLNSAERTPYLLLLEVLDMDDNITDSDFTELVNGNLVNSSQISVPLPLQESRHYSQTGQTSNSSNESVSSFKSVSNSQISMKMKTAAIMLAQLTRKSTAPHITKAQSDEFERIRAGIIREMEALEKERLIDALHSGAGSFDFDGFDVGFDISCDGGYFDDITKNNDDGIIDDVGIKRKETPNDTDKIIQNKPLTFDQTPLFDEEDPSCSVLGENWETKLYRLRNASPYGSLEGWRLLSIIVKSGIDMRQEQLASHLISLMSQIWKDGDVDVWVRPYHILATSSSGAIIETITNSLSLHSIKKMYFKKARRGAVAGGDSFSFSLKEYYVERFGNGKKFRLAQQAFIESLAAYSIITYILQLRDRHDGNILIDDKGHLIHIDFGFMLSNSPGYVGIETAPFKLTPEYIDLIGGMNSDGMTLFKEKFFQAFIELRKYADRFITTIEIMQQESHLPCFDSGGESASVNVRNRFHLGLTDQQLKVVLEKLIISSAYNLFTKLYDSFQYYSNGVF